MSLTINQSYRLGNETMSLIIDFVIWRGVLKDAKIADDINLPVCFLEDSLPVSGIKLYSVLKMASRLIIYDFASRFAPDNKKAIIFVDYAG